MINCRGFCRNFMLEKTMYVCISSNIVVLPRVSSSHSLVLNVLSIFALKEFNFVQILDSSNYQGIAAGWEGTH